jgi:hypothetical protein
VPTVIKSSSNVAKLGDLSTYSVKTAAIPYDTSDTSGAVPTVTATMADGTDTDYLIGESLTLSNQALGQYTGEITNVSSATNSGRYTLTAETIISRLNSDQRLYPSQGVVSPTPIIPLSALDYWSQQCGIFYDNVEGDVLFYQSQFYHWFAFAKGTTRPIRANNPGLGAAGEEVQFYVQGTRRVTNFGKNRDLSVTFPATEKLPVQIPAIPDPRQVVFSSWVYNQGTGRRASTTWNFVTPTKQTAYMQVIIDNTSGISLQVTDPSGVATALSPSIPAAINGIFRINLGVTTYSTTQTKFTLSALDVNGNVIATQSANFPCLITGNLSLASIVYHGENQGSGNQILHWGDAISIMGAMPTKVPAEQKNFTAGVKSAQSFSGFSGNVWETFKAYCSIFQLDVSCAGGKFTVGPRQTETTPVDTLGALSKSISKRDQARFVEVVCQNSVPTLSGNSVLPMVMWKADTVYQVAVGETQTFLVQTDHSILQLSQPVAVSGITPFPYTSGAGQYVVTGSDGYIVAPQFWRDQGGSITVDTTDNEGEIKVTITGPKFDSVRAPYRISEGDAGRPALYVSGQGVINTPTTLRVSTGNTKAAKEVGVTLDNPFIANVTLAYDAAARAARKFATPDVSVTVNEALDYDSPSALGVIPAGQLIKRDGNILRLTDVTQSPSGISGTAVQHNTIAQVKKSFGSGTTIAQAKTYNAGKTIGQANLKPLKVVK